jgi:hypothetical protein
VWRCLRALGLLSTGGMMVVSCAVPATTVARPSDPIPGSTVAQPATHPALSTDTPTPGHQVAEIASPTPGGRGAAEHGGDLPATGRNAGTGYRRLYGVSQFCPHCDEAKVERAVGAIKLRMRDRVRSLSDEEYETLFAYLAENFNDTKPGPPLPRWFLEMAGL